MRKMLGVHIFFNLVFYVLEILRWPTKIICTIISSKSKCLLPPIEDDLLLKSATELSEQIRTRKVKCKDVIRAYVDRCRKVNVHLNAIVQDRFDDALQEAEEHDAFLESSEFNEFDLRTNKPLFGIPVTVKESISVKGMSNRAGYINVKPEIAEEDADIVKQVKDAGAIILCVTNTPILCMWIESSNPITGTTNNPYDHSRSCGGSSGGEGALIGAGASVIGLGSDISGSLRLPALWNGIFGYKPSQNCISVKGHIPTCTQDWWSNVFTFGPMTRYAEDLPLITSVLQKTLSKDLQVEQNVDISQLKYYYISDHEADLPIKVDSDLINAMHSVQDHFKQKYKISFSTPFLKHFKNAYLCLILRLFTIETIEYIFAGKGERMKFTTVIKGILKKMFFMSEFPWYTIVFSVLHCLAIRISGKELEDLETVKSEIQNELEDLLKNDGVIMSYSCTEPAIKHNEAFGYLPGMTLSGVYNLAGLPAIQCPVGLNSEGIPVGIQIVTSRGNDRYLFALAKEIQQNFGGWVQPKPLNKKSNKVVKS